MKLRTLNLQILKVLSDLKKHSLQKKTYSAGVFPSPPTDMLCLLPLTEKINPSLSANNAVTFSEGDAKENNTGVFQGPAVVASRPLTTPKAKQSLRA